MRKKMLALMALAVSLTLFSFVLEVLAVFPKVAIISTAVTLPVWLVAFAYHEAYVRAACEQVMETMVKAMLKPDLTILPTSFDPNIQ